MSDADDFLVNARKAFRLASDSTDVKSVTRYAEMGCGYLQLAQDAANLSGTKSPSWENLS